MATRTVSVYPRAIFCELQPITILDTVLPESAISADVQLVLDKVKNSKEITTREQQRFLIVGNRVDNLVFGHLSQG